MSEIKSKYINYRSIQAFILLASIILSSILKAQEVIPYVVKNKHNLIFNYFTEKPCETAIFFSDTRKALENLNDTDVNKLEEQNKIITDDLYGKIVLIKPGGSTDWSLKVPFHSTYHRIKIFTERIKKFYTVYNGCGKFSKIFISPSGSKKLTRFALINHTRAELLKTGKYKFYNESFIDDILSFCPQYLFHSGDLISSIYNIEIIKKESLNVFKNLAPSVPVILSFSNHDVGWPLVELSYPRQNGLLKNFFPFSYIENSAHHITVFDNVILLSIEYPSLSRNSDDMVNTIIEKLGKHKKPLVILTGGLRRLENLKKIIASLPYTKIVIGGDGGKYQEIELSESVKYIFLRHYDMFAIANIRGKSFFMEIRTSKGLYKSLTFDLEI